MARWRKRLFCSMFRKLSQPDRVFGLPQERTKIMKSQIEL